MFGVSFGPANDDDDDVIDAVYDPNELGHPFWGWLEGVMRRAGLIPPA